MNLERENGYVLALLQATLGSVSANIRLIGLDIGVDKISLRFIMEQESASDLEEIDDIVFEFEALQESILPLEVDLKVSDDPLDLSLGPKRVVYLRREM